MKKIDSYTCHNDKRGTFRGIINSGRWEEANFISTRKGEVRGGHYHKVTEELFYIINGKISIVISNLDGEKIKSFEVSEGDIFMVEPFEVHTFKCEEDSSWINFLSIKFDSETPDIHLP
jgi:mannose-6-phosphate isomerase-like protein (cupin superfamily)